MDPATIKQQAHMSLAERAAAFNLLFDQEMERRELGKLYRGMGISK